MKSMKKPSHRRYTHDTLLYESFYVSIVNSLIVALAPLGIFILTAAIEEFPMNKVFWLSTFTVTQMVFIISFFVNFLYYAYFVRARKMFNYLLALVTTCSLAFMVFFSEYGLLFSNEHNITIVASWFVLLAMILIGHRTGWLGIGEQKYENETWLYKHQVAEDGGDDAGDIPDPVEQYTHKYIDHHDENAPEQPNKPIDPEQDPKRAARLT